MDLKHFELFMAFNAVVVLLLMLDLFVFHKKDHVISVREALLWSAFWIVLSLGLALLIYLYYYDFIDPVAGRTNADAAQEFLMGYFIEKSLSVDNLFVFLLIFSRFKLPSQYQHKVLFWGIFGAIVMRVIFIFAGVELLKHFEWIIYVFGGFLLFTGFKLLKEDEPDVNLEKNPLLQFARRFIPMTTEYSGGKFFTRYNGVRYATPMFLILLLVESTDLLFAVDSIPAVLGISSDFFIIYSSNIMAILGLRSLFFALHGIMKYFRYLNLGLAVVLMFIGGKMIATGFHYHMDNVLSISIVGGILAIAIIASVLNPLSDEEAPAPLPEKDEDEEQPEETKDEAADSTLS